MGYWWLSFVGDDGFAGACVVPAGSMVEAMIEATCRGINPGGEVSAVPLPEDKPPAPAEFVGRLLTIEQVAQFDQAWRRAVH